MTPLTNVDVRTGPEIKERAKAKDRMTSFLEPNKGSNFYGTSQVEAFEKTIGASGSNSTSGSSPNVAEKRTFEGL